MNSGASCTELVSAERSGGALDRGSTLQARAGAARIAKLIKTGFFIDTYLPRTWKTNGNDRSTSVRYTPRAFRKAESDQQGAMPREERHARRIERCGGKGSEAFRLAARQ